jgi:hypothetical protein
MTLARGSMEGFVAMEELSALADLISLGLSQRRRVRFRLLIGVGRHHLSGIRLIAVIWHMQVVSMAILHFTTSPLPAARFWPRVDPNPALR